MKKKDKNHLESIPYIGPAIALDLRHIGIKSVKDLKSKNPEKLYQLSNKYEGRVQDPCLLYTYRYAVYFAEGGQDKTKLKWWAWKDKK